MSSDPDFIQRNGAWLLSVIGLLTTCLSGCLVYMLKSRCTKIKCCGFECERDVVQIDARSANVETLQARDVELVE